MSKEFDFQTVDWCRSKQSVAQGERMVWVLRRMISNPGRTSVKEIHSWIGGTIRPARTFVEQLEDAGYIVGDREKPEGFKATDKAKQLLGVQGC